MSTHLKALYTNNHFVVVLPTSNVVKLSNFKAIFYIAMSEFHQYQFFVSTFNAVYKLLNKKSTVDAITTKVTTLSF